MFAASKTSTASSGYQISRSLRFNSADSAYLGRTPASASNRTTFTISFWTKITKFDVRNMLFEIFGAPNDNDYFSIEVSSTNQLGFGGYLTTWRYTNQVFRDPSAWYHIVVAIDTTQATANNRARLYVNGSEVTSFAALGNPTQNSNTAVDSTFPHKIGTGTGGYYNGYMTEYYLIDGQQLTPSSFGETNAQTGVWTPIAYSGSYGTNGFYLNFSDNSNTTAATLGKDYSGNGNNWTPNNFSVTAGAGNDSLVDSPTSYGIDTGVGGTVRGNYCTLNPLYKNGSGTPAYTNGNLDMLAGGSAGNDSYFGGTFSISSGKWYYECTVNTIGTGGAGIMTGICKTSAPNGINVGAYRDLGNIYNLDGTSQTSGATYTTGDVVGVAFDIDAGTVQFYKNGTAQGATPSFTFTAGTEVFVRGRSDGPTPSATFNFGQRPFAYTAPSGYKALCTQNLPTPTIGATTATQANLYFNPVLYTGDRTDRTITVGFQPDWVWVKSRSAADDHYLMNAVVGTGKYLSSNSIAAETTNANSLTAYTSTGFSVGNTGTTNETGRTYVAWNWKANGSGSTNTAGSITSTVSANTTSGFSVVTFTGTNANATIGHGLGVAPAMIIMKVRNAADDSWQVYHQSLTSAAYRLQLNSTAGEDSQPTVWNSTAPTSTVFSVGNNVRSLNQVAYCLAPVAGYSAFGKYTGNGSADGPFVFTGMRPAYVMIKVSSAAAPWIVFDAVRNTYNAEDNILYPNTSGAEDKGVGASPLGVDFLSNGFKIRTTDAWVNYNNQTIIYAAFATSPFKYSLAR